MRISRFVSGFLCWIFLQPSVLALSFLEKSHIKVKHPSFLFYKDNPRNLTAELYISSFGLSGQDHISKIADLGGSLSSQSIEAEDFIPSLLWPNEVVDAPESFFGPGYMIIAEGFLVPFKTNGAIGLFDIQTKQLRTLTHLKNGYWYHRVEFWDYNQDGRLDIVSARAKKGMMGSDDSELVVLIAPENPAKGTWKEKVLFKGPDVFFRLVDFDGDSKFEVVAAEFLSKKLSYYFQDSKEQWQENIIDNSIGSLFDLELADLNADGRKDLLVTNHVNDASAGVFAYEIPQNPKSQQWPKHLLYQGFKTSAPGIGQASPGVARIYHPMAGTIEAKPYIVVSGDGAEGAFVLTPASKSVADWNYSQEMFFKTKGAVGQIAIGDADHNGLNEIYVPEYDQDRITIFEPIVNN